MCGQSGSPIQGGSADVPSREPGHQPASARGSFALFVATAGPAGYGPVAPGTWGSAVGVLVYLPLSALPLPLYLLTVTGLLSLGVWASDEAERVFGQKDDGRIVIDEVVGQLLTLAPLMVVGPDPRSLLLVVTGFVAFRVLDIWKPGPVRRAERGFQGGAGVMMDDVVAGLLGALLMGALAWVVA